MKTNNLITAAIALVSGGLSAAAIFLLLGCHLPESGQMNVAPVYLTEREEVVIQENTALKNAIAGAANTAIAVEIASSKSGCGAALTSDGIVAIPYSLFPPGASAEISVAGQKISFEILKRDKDLNLAIAKLEIADLSTAGFYSLENLKLGERIFLVGASPDGSFFTNEGIVRDFDESKITTNIYEKNEVLGAPVFDIEGNILGIADVDKTGLVSVIPISKIKETSGL